MAVLEGLGPTALNELPPSEAALKIRGEIQRVRDAATFLIRGAIPLGISNEYRKGWSEPAYYATPEQEDTDRLTVAWVAASMRRGRLYLCTTEVPAEDVDKPGKTSFPDRRNARFASHPGKKGFQPVGINPQDEPVEGRLELYTRAHVTLGAILEASRKAVDREARLILVGRR
jgi:hypothetical protein